MKEMSFEQDCPVLAVGNDRRFGVGVPEVLPDPRSPRVVVVEAPVTGRGLVPDDEAARGRVEIRRVRGDPQVQRKVGVVAVDISTWQPGVVLERPPLR